MSGTVSDIDLFELAISARLRNLHVAMPARVERYDIDRDAVDVQPVLQRHVPSADREDGTPALETLPLIYSVPLVRPRGAGFFIGIPIAVGDFVLLVFSERDLGQWRATGSISNPGDQREHSLSGAMAIPGIFPVGDGPVDVNNSAIEIGMVDGSFRVTFTSSRMEVGGVADAAALASKVKALETAIVAHTHAVTGATTAQSLELLPPAYNTQDFRSQKLKVED